VLAQSQQGYVTRQSLLALGVSDDAIDHRITTGELIPMDAGVYAVGHREPGPIPIAAAVCWPAETVRSSATTQRRRCGALAGGQPARR
jgi:hypothetical protein